MAVTKTQCPACVAVGRDKSGDNLVDFGNGSKHCLACGYHESNSGSVNKELTTVFLPPGLTPSAQIAGIDPLTCAEWLVLSDGYTSYFPSFNLESSLTGYKTRNYYAEYYAGKSKKETIFTNGSYNLFGTHMLTGNSTLLICEGETDALWWWQNFGHQLDVCGVPGAERVKLLAELDEYIDVNVNTIIVFGDNDTAGRKFSAKATEILPSYKCKIGKYALKDARECTVEQLAEALSSVIDAPTDVVLLKGHNNHIAAQQQSLKNTKCIASVSSLAGVNSLLNGGIYGEDFFGLLGDTGIGKSTLALQLAGDFICQDVGVLYIANENRCSHISNTITKRVGIEPVGKNLVLLSAPHFDDMIKLANREVSNGCKIVIVDVLNGVASDFMDAIPTRRYMKELELLIAERGAAMIAVTHTRAADQYRGAGAAPRITDAAGGRALQQAIAGMLSFTANLPNMAATARSLTVSKNFRYRAVKSDAVVILHFDSQHNCYFEMR